MSGSKAPDIIIIEERQNRRKDIMKIGFIGLGNMATAMIGGMLQKGIAAPEDIIGSARTETTVEKVKTKFNINTTTDNKIVAAQADILFLAVKPIFFPEVIDQIKDVVAEDNLIVSIAAGRTLDYLKEAFGRPELKLIRCMPNTPALVLEGCTGVCAEENVTEEDMEQVLALLRSFGIASVVPERLMDVVVGVSGSSPAYVFMFIEAMADEAVAAGMPRKQAYEFASQSVLGSARMVLETGRHPGELKVTIYSPLSAYTLFFNKVLLAVSSPCRISSALALVSSPFPLVRIHPAVQSLLAGTAPR